MIFHKINMEEENGIVLGGGWSNNTEHMGEKERNSQRAIESTCPRVYYMPSILHKLTY